MPAQSRKPYPETVEFSICTYYCIVCCRCCCCNLQLIFARIGFLISYFTYSHLDCGKNIQNHILMIVVKLAFVFAACIFAKMRCIKAVRLGDKRKSKINNNPTSKEYAKNGDGFKKKNSWIFPYFEIIQQREKSKLCVSTVYVCRT